MNVKFFRFSILALAFGVLFVAGAKSSMAQSATTVTTQVKEPLNYVGQTCDTFEPITFSGYQHTVYEVVNDGAGSLKMHIHSNWQNVSGSTVSGRQYRGVNTSNETIDLDGLPSEHTITVNQRWIGKGKGAPNLIYNLRFNIKVDANGNVTSVKDSETVECKP
jgi:hypothetical protein